ncbi:Crp/Fnr family transcriptional regulator [Telmatospirillum sp.]|uniref:Crp/Fnr family transcriptional regulator n=1 Tax=Telmatospirillum sp. TaxID=2079197 RepID=UPI0028410570|nr:Crp/Fnr family transcriptional regulator [Telmatospirillum sp.]MDR3441277.1 Crp/Fnr family transcriptional regulator [Telmatospirillum sp.]
MTPSQIVPLGRDILVELGQTPLFSGLSEAEIRLLLGGAWTESHPDGVMLFRQGDAADGFFVLLDGHVELFVDDGSRTVLDVAKRPAILGEAALFDDVRHPHAARVVGYAKLLAVPRGPFLDVLDQRFDLAQRLLGAMSIRLRALVGQIAELKLKSTAQRLAGFLLGLARKEEGAVTVRFPYDKRLAAEALGMTAESLSRALGRLAFLGVESRAENLVVIADAGALRLFCAEDGEE